MRRGEDTKRSFTVLLPFGIVKSRLAYAQFPLR